MEVQFDVKMSASALYDFNLQHAYKKPITILTTAVGFVLVVMFIYNMTWWYYLIFGLLAIFFTPVNLFINSFSKAKMIFTEPMTYILNDEGITVKVGEEEEKVTWDKCVKACNTKQSYFIYTSKNAAFIFPHKSMGNKNVDVLQLISEHMDPKNVKIKFGGL